LTGFGQVWLTTTVLCAIPSTTCRRRTSRTSGGTPDHSAAATDRQINDGAMDGFPASYAETLAARGVDDGDPGVVMGYYDASDLPVFDHFAAEFSVCDRWHSSVAGATWPNRLYAVAGSAGGSRDDRKVPIHHEHSFVRYLDEAGASWRWYSHDVATLRLVDVKYRVGHPEHFAYLQKLKLVFKTRGRGLLPAPDRSALVDWYAAEQAARARRLLEHPAGVLRKATTHNLTDLRSGLLAAHRHLHEHGHPAGDP
jgi:hypothetical protein